MPGLCFLYFIFTKNNRQRIDFTSLIKYNKPTDAAHENSSLLDKRKCNCQNGREGENK